MVLTFVWHTILAISLSVVFSLHESNGLENEENEFCQRETMAIRCRWKSEVIVMTSARWGRMRTSRCLNIHSNLLALHGQDHMFLGCSTDVMSIVDSECSGRSECDFRIPDHLDAVTPCYSDLVRYLETSYKCVRVVQESRTCTLMATVEEQYLTGTTPISSTSSSTIAAMSNCGSASHPWRIEAPTGQRINISILDFAAIVGEHRDRQLPCRQYGYVTEKPNKKNVSLCAAVGGASSQRDTIVYTTDTNSVDIVLATGTIVDNYNFLVRINAVGCTNMLPPENGWIKRTQNNILSGCYLSQQTWQLHCDGQEWKGQVGTCPETYEGTVPTSVQMKDIANDTLMVKVAMVIIAVAAVCICLLVVSIGCFCTRRYRNKSDKKCTASINVDQPLMVRDRVDDIHCQTKLNNDMSAGGIVERNDGVHQARNQTWNQLPPQYFISDSDQVV